MIEEHALAKINLALHVTGQRADGYHLLDMLVTFAAIGDRLQFSHADQDRFTVSGRFAGKLPIDADRKAGNLVLRARDLLKEFTRAEGRETPPVHIHLEKNLPIASGIGGGSADAAAALRGLSRLWKLPITPAHLADLGLILGADVPMCLQSRPLIARGIGEDITILRHFPGLHMLLVNPLVEVSTPLIFRSLASKTNPPLVLPADGAAAEAWMTALNGARNDLQPPAQSLKPDITDALDLLTSTCPLLARMSGSGATCFALYETTAACEAARNRVEALRPQWYCEATATVSE